MLFSRYTAAVFFFLTIALAPSGVLAVETCETARSREIEAIAQRPEFARAQWGILLQPLEESAPSYALNENTYFIPASAVKLLTTAAVLQHFGGDYRLLTPLYFEGQPPVLYRLIVVGRGDPSLQTDRLDAIARELADRGVREITELIVDDRAFSEAPRAPSWELEDVYFGYAPAVNPLILNQNQFSLVLTPRRVGERLELSWEDEIAARQWQFENRAIAVAAETEAQGIEIQGIFGEPKLEIEGNLSVSANPEVENIAILNPARYFLDTLRSRLAARGIRIHQARTARRDERLTEGDESVLASPPLAELLQIANRDSNNLYAEALLRLLGIDSEGTSARESGIAAVTETLTALGVDPESYRLADGSGLSRHNLASPRAFVQTLIQMAKTPNFSDYRNSFAVAGASGTLRNRFQDTSLAGKLWGKTGTMSGVTALAGYLEVSDGRVFAFSTLLNRSTLTARAQRQAMDEIVLALSALAACRPSVRSQERSSPQLLQPEPR